jgi:hypothetical protein
MEEPYWSDYLRQFDLPASSFNIPINTNKFCVIVEPRKHKYLLPVIKNFMYLLQGKGWGLIVAHGTENEQFVHDELAEWKNVVYLNLGCPDLKNDLYNDILVSEKFWKDIQKTGCEHSLIFQTDTVLLRDNVDDYLTYDYVGAPWAIEFEPGLRVGNGGLSLRKVSTMLDIIQTHKRTVLGGSMNEDIYFSYWCLKDGRNIPSVFEAKKFAVEMMYYHSPIGLHKPFIQNFPSFQDYIDMLSIRHVR